MTPDTSMDLKHRALEPSATSSAENTKGRDKSEIKETQMSEEPVICQAVHISGA